MPEEESVTAVNATDITNRTQPKEAEECKIALNKKYLGKLTAKDKQFIV